MKKKALLAAFIAATLMVHADPWTTYSLPNTTAGFNTWALGHTDGRYLYAENGTVYRQDNHGNSANTAFSNSPGTGGADPSFIATGSATTATIGTGGVSASTLKTFNPSNTGSSFTNTSFTTQNYSGEMRNASSLYIGGGNGTGGSNNVTYVTTDGSTNQTLITDVSKYSAGIALDSSGNLYVGDNDDGKVYFFTETQLTDAINANTALGIADGTYICDFGAGGNIGSLAVDDNGIVWGTGWAANGIQSYDPHSDSFHTWTPGYDSTHYLLDTFSDNGNHFVAFASADGFASGSQVQYGFASADAVPEPASALLGILGGIFILICRREKLKQHAESDHV